MKKTIKLCLLFIVALLAGSLVGCNKDYSKLGMVFFVGDKSANSVELIIDDNSDSQHLDTLNMSVNISGIDEGDIGKLDINSTNNVVDVTNVKQSGSTISFNITAKRASLSGSKLTITHLKSNKSFSVDLVIKKRSNSVELLNQGKTYVIGIADQERIVNIDPSNLISVNGTDISLWATDSTLPDYVSIANGQSKDAFTKLKIGSSVLDGKEIEIYPVTKFDGYDNIKYENKIIKVRFVKLPSGEDIKTNAQIGDQQIQNLNSESVLSIVPNRENYNFAKISFASMGEDEGDLTNLVNKLSEYYDTIETSFNLPDNSAYQNGSGVILSSTNVKTSTVKLTLTSSRYIGEVWAIEKTFKIRAIYTANNIAINKDQKIISLNSETDQFGNMIYLASFDIFNAYSGSFGTALKFIPTLFFDNGDNQATVAGVDESYRKVKIYIASDLLDDSNAISLKFITSKTGSSLHFTEEGGICVSDTISANDTIYVKYQLNAGDDIDVSAIDLSFRVQNYYGAEDVSNRHLAKLTASTTVILNGKPTIASYQDNNKTIYLKQGENYAQLIDAKNISGNSIYNINLDLCVETGGLAVLDENQAKLTMNGDLPASWNYLNKASDASNKNNTLTISAENLSVGSYQLRVYQEGTGYEAFVLTVIVYEDFETFDVKFSLNQTPYVYRGADYSKTADYIVPNIDLDLDLAVTDLASTGILKGYEFGFGPDISSIITTTSKNNEIKLNFKDVDPTNYQILTLTITVSKLKIENHTASDETESITTTKTFYIYNKIDQSDLALGYNNAKKYSKTSLCDYDINQNRELYINDFTLNIVENKKTDISSIKWFSSYNYGAKTKIETGITDSGYRCGVEYLLAGYYIITVEVEQFGVRYVLTKQIVVEDAIITEAIKLKNTEVYVDADGERYIELKQGESFTFDVEQQSSMGKVSNPGFVLLIIDDDGNKIMQLVENDATIIASNMNLNNKIALLVARDALSIVPGSFDNFADSLLDSNYPMAYLSVRIYVTDGTPEYPHLIKTGSDFWNISNGADKCYKIMSDINVGTTENKSTIDDFTGTITTKNDVQLNIYGLELNDNLKNVFKEFGGSLNHITFNVRYNYKSSSGDLGIIGITASSARLTDICVEVSEDSSVNGQTDLVFGALVGVNAGIIEYKSINLCGVGGKVTITGNNKQVIVGGLIGSNTGTVTGSYSPNSTEGNEIVYVSSLVKSGYISGIVFDLIDFNGSSTVGGLVGNNTGTISNVAVICVITNDDKTANNIGGVIGTNIQDAEHAKLTQFIKSASTINGGENIGGITGKDINGKYDHCMYQIRYTASYSKPNLNGQNNVGGIIGLSSGSILRYCSTYSYRWDYSQESLSGIEDIHSTSNAGGLVGSGTYIADNDKNSVNALINGTTYKSSLIKDSEDKPIIELAPTTITADVKADYRLGQANIMLLEYYRFATRLNGLDEIEITTDEMRALRAYFEKLLDGETGVLVVSCLPENIGRIELNVSSNNRAVIDFTSGGKLVIKGSGSATVTLSSVLNPSISVSVQIVIIDALAQSGSYIITDIQSSNQNLGADSVGKGQSKLYYLSISQTGNKLNANGNGVYYTYLPNVNLGVMVKGEDDYSNYASINGENIRISNKQVNNDKAISITVKERQPDERDRLNLIFTPFVTGLGEIKILSQSINLQIDTRVGLKDLSLAHTSKVLYPSETVNLEVTLHTDKTLSDQDVIGLISVYLNEYRVSYEGLLIFDIKDLSNDIQIVHVKITNPVLTKTQPKQELRLIFTLPDGRTYSADYLLLPERIDTISIQNYLAEEGSGESPYNNPIDYIMEGYQNFMIIKMSPETAYFDYVEIRDITGTEELGFMQLRSLIDLHTIDVVEITPDGKGIRLKKGISDEANELYVLIVLGEQTTYEHKIELRAYAKSESGDILLTEPKVIDIFVQMKPDVDVVQVLPSGVQEKIQFVNSQATIYDAKNININFVINKRNAETMAIATTNCNLINTSNAFYTFHRIKDSADATVTFTLTTTSKDGRLIVETKTIKFVLAEFVIHSVSATPSTSNRISGELDKETAIEFYFDRNDISYFDPTYGAFNRVYYSGARPTTLVGIEKAIYGILDAINDPNNLNKIISIDDDLNIELLTDGGYKVKVTSGYSRQTQLKLKLNLNYKGDKTFEYDFDANSTIIENSWGFNFQDKSAEMGTAIHNQREFEDMISGEKYYLANDITLGNYTPIDVDLIWFNGNGNTITIESFAPFTDTDIKAGLFKQIYSNMLVENLTVNYQTKNSINGYTLGNKNKSYLDLCSVPDAIDYVSAEFGGISPINYGIITNCKVEGSVSLRASTVESKYTSGYEIAFNIGSIVTVNGLDASTGLKGTITNTTSNLKIYALASVGGFVHTNNGVITSSVVSDSSKVYGYNEFVTQSIKVNVGGFVVENGGRIDMCAVESSNSVKDVSAGFVYSNKGQIKNSYAKVDTLSQNNNNFYGFVYKNSGEIAYSYSYINMGRASYNNVYMFASSNTSNLLHCAEISDSGSNGFSGDAVKIIIPSNAGNKNEFASIGFSFGEENDSVWTILDYPRLNSARVTINPKASVGTKNNPLIVYNIDTWKNTIDYLNGYIRIVRDLDFSSVNENPKTSSFTFSGNIEGNGMKIENIMIYSNDNLASIGLFASLNRDGGIVENRIANLTLTTRQFTATKTNAVGLLAGIIQDYKLFNISIDSKNTVILGKNAVGGLAGVVKGNFAIDKIVCNASVNSTKQTTTKASVYTSLNNNVLNTNLEQVYYAGSVVGILDGFDSTTITHDWDMSKLKYCTVNDIMVSGDVVAIGDVVGAGFGFVGEFVEVTNLDIKLGADAKIKGQVYSSGLVGENRGKLMNSKVWFDYDEYQQGSTALTKSEPTITFADTVAVGGAVGLNIGGLVEAVEVYNLYFKDNRSGRSGGGIVCKNINGTITNVVFNGRIEAYIIGLIVGEETRGDIIKAYNGVAGLANSNLDNIQQLSIVAEYDGFINLDGCAIDRKTIDWYLSNNSKFIYLYENQTGGMEPEVELHRSSAFGLLIGVDNRPYTIEEQDAEISISRAVYYTVEGDKFVFVVPDAEGECFDLDSLNAVGWTNNVDQADALSGVLYYIGDVSSVKFNSWDPVGAYESCVLKFAKPED